MITQIVNVRGKKPAQLRDDLRFVYCGRQCAGWPRSTWANPFKIGDSWRSAAAYLTSPGRRHAVTPRIERFAAELAELGGHMLARGDAVYCFYETLIAIPRFNGAVLSLLGKRLGCWCLDFDGEGDPPMTCHCSVLALAAEGLMETLHHKMEDLHP